MLETLVSTRDTRPGSFRDVLAHHPVVVIHMWAPWNRIDLAMYRMIRPFIAEYQGRIEFRSRNVDLGLWEFHPRIPDFWNVPALVCFLEGRWIETAIGLGTAPDLRTRLEGWLAGVACHPILYGNGPIADHGP